MDRLLVKYLSTHKSIKLGEIGSLIKNAKSASLDKINDTLLAPMNTIELIENKEKEVDGEFLTFLSDYFDASHKQLNNKVESYINGIVNDIYTSGERKIEGLGTIKTHQGNLQFYREVTASKPVIYTKKIIRSNSIHTLKVGDKEFSNKEMLNYLEKKGKVNLAWMYWLAGALFLTLIIIMLFYYA